MIFVFPSGVSRQSGDIELCKVRSTIDGPSAAVVKSGGFISRGRLTRRRDRQMERTIRRHLRRSLPRFFRQPVREQIAVSARHARVVAIPCSGLLDRDIREFDRVRYFCRLVTGQPAVPSFLFPLELEHDRIREKIESSARTELFARRIEVSWNACSDMESISRVREISIIKKNEASSALDNAVWSIIIGACDARRLIFANLSIRTVLVT